MHCPASDNQCLDMNLDRVPTAGAHFSDGFIKSTTTLDLKFMTNPESLNTPAREVLPSVHIIDSELESPSVQEYMFRDLSPSLADELENAGILTELLRCRLTNYISQIVYSRFNHKPQSLLDIASLVFDGDVGKRFIKLRADKEIADFYMLRNSPKQIVLEAHQRLPHGEESWSDISLRWGAEPEKHKSGYYSLMPVLKLPQEVGLILRQLQVEQLSNPTRLGKYYGVIQLASYVKPELTDQLRDEILMIIFNEWIESRVDDLKTHFKEKA